MRIEITIVMVWTGEHHITFQENNVFTIYNGLYVKGDIVRPLYCNYDVSETSKHIFKRVYKK